MRVPTVLFYLYYDFRGSTPFLEKTREAKASQPPRKKQQKREAYTLFP
jgi:hypothetical protein